MRGTQNTASAGPSRDRVIEQEMNQLDRSIKKFQIDAQRFLVGDLHIPPEELRESIVSTLRRLRNTGTRGVAENFRLNSLEARFNSQVDLYNRKVRRREEGQSRAATKKKAPDPMKGVVVGQGGEGNAVEVLYKGLFLETGARKPSMDLEKFRSYINRQAEVIRSKTGCSDIHFRVAVEEGTMKIKAKPVKSKAR